MRWLALSATLLAWLLYAVYGSAAAPPKRPAPRGTQRTVAQSHFVLIVLENRELDETIGESSAPYLNALARHGVLAGDYHAITHPSLPNYIALLAGDPLGIEADCSDCQAHGVTLVDQLERAHLGWAAYMQDMPAACYGGPLAGGYAKKHNPFMYFGQIAGDPARCSRVMPLTRLGYDMRRGRLAAFTWITPNLCSDGHDCTLAASDRFLARQVPPLLRGLGPRGVLAIVWDEGTSASGCCGLAAGGRVALILAGPRLRGGYRLASPADHYSLLRLIEDSFGLPRLRGAACGCTPSLNAAFSGGSPPRLNRR